MISRKMFWTLSAFLLGFFAAVCAFIAGAKIMSIGNGQSVWIVIGLTAVALITGFCASECWDKRY